MLGSKEIARRLLNAVEQKKSENQDNTTILVAAPPFIGSTGKRWAWSDLWVWILILFLFAVLVPIILWN